MTFDLIMQIYATFDLIMQIYATFDLFLIAIHLIVVTFDLIVVLEGF